MAAKCKAKNTRGQPCSAAPGKSGFCFAHDPAQGRTRAEARKRGGQHRAAQKVSGPAVQIANLADVLRVVNCVLADSWELDNSPGRSRVILSACETAIKALQIGELETRVQALERAREVKA